MKSRDPALAFSNPRLLGAVYFGLLSVAATVLINAFLTSFGVVEIIPLFQAVLLGMVVASATGAIFGERIVHCKKPYKMKTFGLGFLMVVASLPVFDLGLLFFMKESNNAMFAFMQLHNLLYTYLFILIYSYFLFGFLLAIAAGFAAMYLRGQIVYDILHTHERRKRSQKQTIEHHKGHVSHR